MHKTNCRRPPKDATAFSRADLIAVIAVVAVLGVGLGSWVGRSGAAARVCAANLKQLGMAMATYEQDNGNRIPYAYVELGSYKNYEASKTVWDSLIFPYIPPGKNGLAQKHLLRCPADTIPQVQMATRRTYAMPTHSNKGDNWPLSPENDTGIGVWYARWEKRKELTNYILTATTQDDESGHALKTVALPAFKLEMIHAPASTLLLTEHATAVNTAFNFHGATIDSEQDHVVATNLDIAHYHGGKINYLMVDGHVESLNPGQSAGRTDPGNDDTLKDYPNIWKINQQ